MFSQFVHAPYYISEDVFAMPHAVTHSEGPRGPPTGKNLSRECHGEALSNPFASTSYDSTQAPLQFPRIL